VKVKEPSSEFYKLTRALLIASMEDINHLIDPILGFYLLIIIILALISDSHIGTSVYNIPRYNSLFISSIKGNLFGISGLVYGFISYKGGGR